MISRKEGNLIGKHRFLEVSITGECILEGKYNVG